VSVRSCVITSADAGWPMVVMMNSKIRPLCKIVNNLVDNKMGTD
jgi:hypothetical protein